MAYQKAPILAASGERSKRNFYSLPKNYMDYLFANCSPNEIKIMIVLLGTKEGFIISPQWLSDRTNINTKHLYTYLNSLEKKGIIKRGGEVLTIQYEVLNILAEEEEQRKKEEKEKREAFKFEMESSIKCGKTRDEAYSTAYEVIYEEM